MSRNESRNVALSVLCSSLLLTGCGGGVEGSEPAADTTTQQSEQELAAAALTDSWSVHFDCLGGSTVGSSAPTLQIHYHEWQTIPRVTTVLRGVDGYAFYVPNSNWRVRQVTIRVYDTAPGGSLLETRTFNYGGTGSASNLFSHMAGVTKGRQMVKVDLNTYSDICTGTLKNL